MTANEIVPLIICSLITGAMALALATYFRKKELERVRKEVEKQIRISGEAPGYTNSILEFIRNFIAQIAVLKFREFADAREVSKITKEQIKHLVEDIAKTSRKHIDWNRIDTDRILFSPKFLDEYIVNMSVNCVKDLLKKAVDDELIDIIG